MLFAGILMKSYEMADSRGVTRSDTGAIVNLLGPTSRMIFDQLARVSVRTTIERRALILDALRLPSGDIKKRFTELPMSGEDLFGGQFDKHLQEEADKRVVVQSSDILLPPRPFQPNRGYQRGRPSWRRGGRGSRGNQSGFPTRGRG